MHRREAADIGRGVIGDFGRHRLRPRRLGARRMRVVLVADRHPAGRRQRRLAEQRHRCCGSQIGARRHGGERAGVENVGAGAGGARTARRHIGDHRHRGRQHGADDVAHRAVQPAGRVEAQHGNHRIGLLGRRKATLHIAGGRGPDCALDGDHQRCPGTGRGRVEGHCRQAERQRADMPSHPRTADLSPEPWHGTRIRHTRLPEFMNVCPPWI